jgi:hypothetical protein
MKAHRYTIFICIFLLLSCNKKNKLSTGEMPKCYQVHSSYSNLNNSLEISVGNNTDVALKLIDIYTNKCIRFVYVESNKSYSALQIPESKYILKIAYGKKWIKSKKNGTCTGKFKYDALYEMGSDTLDFHVKKTQDGISIPSFKLQLNVIKSKSSNSFNSKNITEEEFNQ